MMEFGAGFSFEVERISKQENESDQKRKAIPHEPESQKQGSASVAREHDTDREQHRREAVSSVTAEAIRTEPLVRNSFFEKPSDGDITLMHFETMNLSKSLLKACKAMDYSTATPIQAAAIPLILSGRDICGSAITGSGKTAAFALPLLERLLHRPMNVTTTYVLVIAPTRELAIQIHTVITELAKFSNIEVALIVGGFSLQVQSATLDARPEIVVATPGRLIDHLRNSRSFDLDDVHAVVLDEADKLLKMGFINEIKEILRHLPKKRQTMLFSATMTEEVKKLMQLSLHKPVRIAADPSGRVPRKLIQEIIRLKGDDMRKQKEAALCALCSRTFAEGHAIIFCATKSRAHRIKLLFEMLKLPPTGELHSNMSQSARLDSLEKFRNKDFAYLVATDVAGRGLDIMGVQVVINYDAPPSLDTYLHRIGRTARAGAEGRAVTFITDTNRELVKEILPATKQKLINRILPDEAIAYYSQQIQLHQRHLKVIERNESENEKLEHAEMEAERAKNVIEHEKEIMAKPPRTWFQTNKQRKEMQKLARMEEDGLLGTGGVFSVQCEEETVTKKQKKNRKGEHSGQKDSERAETKTIKGTVRAIKQYHRLYESQGSDSKAAIKRAHESVMSSKRSKKHDRDDAEEEGFLKDTANLNRKKAKPSKGTTQLFDTQGAGTGRVYSGGAKSGRIIAKKTNKGKLNRIKRGGKGKHAFKGKSKFKRR